MDLDLDLRTDKLIGRKEREVGWLIFNNPARRNAVSLEMWGAIPKVLAAFEADPEVRLAVFTGAGEKAFVSGADISQFEKERADAAAEARYSAASGAASAAMAAFSKPAIAMIRGACIGGGLAVALTCDLRICEEGARFAIPAARLGLGYGFGGIKALVDLVGPAIGREILFTARQFSAEEA
ncbi:MAG: enoyl-CoA hydratase-related protein, partial [Caulobacteraceae bacterium]